MVDDLDDFSKTDFHSAGLQVDTSNPDLFEDVGKIDRTNTNGSPAEYLIYRALGAQQIVAIAFLTTGDQANSNFHFLSSPDNNTFTEQSITSVQDTYILNGGWIRRTYTVSGLPGGTNYLKVQFRTGGPVTYDPLLSRVVIDYTPPATTTGSYSSIIQDASGNIGVGTIDPSPYKLAVNGGIHAKEIVVETGWSDFVFADGYHLKPLLEVENQIKEDKHLSGIPSAKDVESHGVSVGVIQSKLLQKVEELTLYVIELKKENEALKKRVATLESK